MKDSIDGLLARGQRRESVLAYVRRLTGGPEGEGGLTYLACEAYLESKP